MESGVALPPILISDTFEVVYSVSALISPTQTLCLTLTLRASGSIELPWKISSSWELLNVSRVTIYTLLPHKD
jgi:predicted transcriptional regulator YheO